MAAGATVGTAPTYPPVRFADVLALQQRLADDGVYIIKTENLYLLDGVRAFSLGQGE